jgi:L-ascorbate metabolism protein UlaG (beta-lactamase superfamily)
LPQTSEVIGFVLDVDHGPRIWISGDTVLHPALVATLKELRRERPVDVAIVHCGAVAFPRMPLLGRARFTFDAAEAREACRILEPRLVVPIHRAGWAHFREPEEQLFSVFGDVAHRRLALGQTMTL